MTIRHQSAHVTVTRALKLTGNHSHASSYAALVLDIDDLIVDNIIPGFIHAHSVWACFQSFRNLLDVKNLSVNDMLGPLSDVSGVREARKVYV